MYVLVGARADRLPRSYDATAYWCTRTQKPIGPDGGAAHADTCQGGPRVLLALMMARSVRAGLRPVISRRPALARGMLKEITMKRAVLATAFMLAAAPALAGGSASRRIRRGPHRRGLRRRLHHEQPGRDDRPPGGAGVARHSGVYDGQTARRPVGGRGRRRRSQSRHPRDRRRGAVLRSRGRSTSTSARRRPQRQALVKMAREASRGLITEVVEVKAAPVRFDSSEHASTSPRATRRWRSPAHAPRPELRRDEVVHAVHAAR